MNQLTKREQEVWEICSECKEPICYLSEMLNISDNTFNLHLKSIRRKKNAVDGKDVIRIYYLEKINQIKNPPSPPAFSLKVVQKKRAMVVSFDKYKTTQQKAA